VGPHRLNSPSPRPSPPHLVCSLLGSSQTSPPVYSLSFDYSCFPTPVLLHSSGLQHTPVFSLTGPCTPLPSAYFPLVHPVRTCNEPMRLGAVHFLLRPNPLLMIYPV
jgi:hypothetical protein